MPATGLRHADRWPAWQKPSDAPVRAARDQGRSLGLDQHADLACRTIGALGARFAKAEPAAPEFNHGLRHHGAAALPALHHCFLASLAGPSSETHRTNKSGGSFSLAED